MIVLSKITMLMAAVAEAAAAAAGAYDKQQGQEGQEGRLPVHLLGQACLSTQQDEMRIPAANDSSCIR